MNSPEKQARHQSQGSRWIVSREDRRKVLEMMEKAREEQKRRKKRDWCRLESNLGEFEEFWGNDEIKLNESDLKRLSLVCPDEGKKEEVVTVVGSCEASLEVIVDFDCIERLLVRLSRFSTSESISRSASYILKSAAEVYRSELLFYSDLKEFDQPFFTYYEGEDDGISLKQHDFSHDDLGRYSRNRSYQDRTRKFYRERAYRHRRICEGEYRDFFKENTLKNLRADLEYLDANCSDFHFWMKRAISRRGVLMISSNPLMEAFSLFLVLSRLVDVSVREISRGIWSSSKYGAEWSLSYILKRHPGSAIRFLTKQKDDSKLALEASRVGLIIIDK
jgi:hypothetical protein